MKKFLQVLTLASMMSLTLNSAHAGAGLSLGALANFSRGHVLIAAIGGGLGAASLVHGVRLVQNGSVGWGVFFLILEEQNIINADDVKALDALDVSSKEAFLEIVASEEAPEVKEDMIKALFN